MLNLNTKNESPLNTNTNNNTNYNSILAFKPRQVILSAHHHNPKPITTMNLVSNESQFTNLTPEIKVKLDALILNYLNRNGFNKTLKRFQSEARIETDTWKASSLHLEDIFCKYNACNADGNKNTSKKPVFGQDKPIDYDNIYPTNEEPTTKKKKKGTTESENGAIVDQSEVIGTKMVESDTKRVDEPELKQPKKKKKTKHDLYSSSQAEVKIDTINGLKIDDSTKKTKEKKKKSMQQDKLMPSTSNDNELATDDVEKERKKKKKKSTTDGAVKDEEADIVKVDAESENMSSKEKKSSKKRKRDENENQSTEVTISEESKCQKTQTFEEEKSKKEEINPQETSNKQLDGQTNGKLETNGEKSDAKKSTKKRRNVTDEPKTVIAFQRVKIDQVEFADEKLQDNSYWAKDGADIGYGAKAQEVLGQVRGRDFRHEKTKKKRGSYRGGPIDLQSHSIKFSYSDEE